MSARPWLLTLSCQDKPRIVASVTNAFGMQVFLVTRHEDVKTVLSDHARFSNGRPPGFVVAGAPPIDEEEAARNRAGNLLGLDPPEHSRLRRMLTPEFTIRRIQRLQPRIIEIVDAQLDALVARAREICPALADAPVIDAWAGVRPRAQSRAPLLGGWPGRPGHFVANGGFKIGFGMAPAMAAIMADLVLSGEDRIPDGFRLG